MRFLFLLVAMTHAAHAFADGPITIPARTPVDVGSGKAGVVATTSPLASQVGRECLESGGNAVDAAVAIGFTLAVSWPEAGNIGGGGFMMIAPSKIDTPADVVCIDYREKAPYQSTTKSFVGWTNSRHAMMAGTPGSVAGLAKAHQRYGSLAWKDLLAPAIQLARDGFIVDDYLAYSLNTAIQNPAIRKKRYDEFRRVFAPPNDNAWVAGDRLIQPDLAGTLQRIAEEGSQGFYAGDVADLIVAEMERGDGMISHEDLRRYRAIVRPAYRSKYLNHDIYGAPLPSSGGLTVGMQLRLIESLKLEPSADQPWTARHVHLMAESMRRAFRERAASLGDPDFSAIDYAAYKDQHIESLAKTIEAHRATPSIEIAGDIPIAEGPYESEQTTHYSVVDASGMAVSTTTTLERSFGCWIVVRGAGFLLNNEMGDFNWNPGYTNREGKIGTQPNLVGPGKRMLSSMSPTIVVKDGKPILAVGSPGGRTIINTVTEVIVQTIGFNRTLAKAVDSPRFHHQWFPDYISLEDDKTFDPVIEGLAERGHKVIRPQGRRQGSVHAIEIDPENGVATGVSDWRRGGSVETAF